MHHNIETLCEQVN